MQPSDSRLIQMQPRNLFEIDYLDSSQTPTQYSNQLPTYEEATNGTPPPPYSQL
ncbi:MAG: hypothetical protein MHMPM18_001000 [Marteilia pararefringens]